MKKHPLFAIALALASVSPGWGQQAPAINNPLDEQAFHKPPTISQSMTLWMWINGNVTKEGITADLESFKKVGLAGTEQFLIGGTQAGTSKGVDDPSLVFLSPRWLALEHFAETESARLGLEFGTHNCPGWSSSGGPWIKPEFSMQKVISAETTFKGPGKFQARLNTGQPVQNYYADIAVLAFHSVPYTGPQVSTGVPPGATGQMPVGVLRGTPIASVPIDSIINLTDKMTPDGTLTWDAPDGDWVIVRLGHTTTGQQNAAAPDQGKGLECDKMSREALEAHYAAYPAKLLADAGALAGTTFKRFEIDSYEAGPQDWTPKMREEFQKRRGYDIIPFLAYTTRRNLIEKDGTDISDRFVDDYNITIAELFADNYYGYLQELIHKTPGLQFMFEPYNTSRYSPMDTNNLCKYGDIIMAEFWQRPSTWGWNCVKTVTSGAHTWGKTVVAAEAFTGQPNFAYQSDPYMLKASGDRAYAIGVNKLMYHTSALQPWLNVAPGMTMGQFGTHFGRTITWWEHGAKEWIAYQNHAQALLQQGHSVGDLCFLQYDRRDPLIPAGYDGDNIGSDVILTRMTVQNGRLTLPNGVSYAALVLPNRTTMRPDLLQKLHDLVNDGGTIIGPKPLASSSMENYPACDATVAKLTADMWGNADGTSVTEHALGKGHVYVGVKPEQALAKQGIVPDLDLATNAEKSPFLWVHRQTADADIYFISNQSDDPVSAEASFRIFGKIPELWHAETDSIEQAPVWQPMFPKESAGAAGRTRIPLNFDPSGSVFVIFRKPATGVDPVATIARDGQPDPTAILRVTPNTPGSRLIASNPGTYTLTTASGKKMSATVAPLPAAIDLSTNWQVTFPPKLGAPEKISLDKLINLSQHSDPGVKYFSGTATYSKTFDIPQAQLAPGHVLTLDLGTVKNVAEVRINGKDLPLMWLPPFRAEVTPALRAGANTLEVRITNLWINRLIGDEQLPDDLQWSPMLRLGAIQSGYPLAVIPDWVTHPQDRPEKGRVTFSTFKYYNKNSPLPPSGLIGPVSLTNASQIDFK